MKSKAPILIADTAMSMSPCPVMRMIGRAKRRSTSRRTRSSPDAPGRRTSDTTQSNVIARSSAATNSSAVRKPDAATSWRAR